MIKKFLAFTVATLLMVVAIILVNTWQLSPKPSAPITQIARTVDVPRVVSHLAKAITFHTVSIDQDEAAFSAFQEWLKTAFPLVHSAMELEVLGGGTLLYTWSGRDSEALPVLLAGHYDVVPVDPATLAKWIYAPFEGTVAEGHVWGRGTLDNKGAVIAMLEAAETLIATGFRPRQTIYFSFGHDEEVGGKAGAGAVAQKFEDDGIRVEWSLDEGSFVLDGIMPGIQQPVAGINVAEKGFVTLLITAKGAGGHSSMPPRETAVATLARAIIAIQDNPLPGGLSGVAANMFDELAPHLGFSQRLLFANRWLFGPLLESMLASNPSTDALLRTTTAPTMLSGSIKENVLPSEAVATINFRIHPRDNPAQLIQHIRDLVANDKVDVSILNDRITPASSVSSHHSSGYNHIAQSLRQTYGDIIVLPGLTLAGTDSKHYSKVANDSYRINPFVLRPGDATRFHGINERLSTEDLAQGVLTFMHLMESL